MYAANRFIAGKKSHDACVHTCAYGRPLRLCARDFTSAYLRPTFLAAAQRNAARFCILCAFSDSSFADRLFIALFIDSHSVL